MLTKLIIFLGMKSDVPGHTGTREAATASVIVLCVFVTQAITVGLWFGREYFDMQLPLLLVAVPAVIMGFYHAWSIKIKNITEHFNGDFRPPDIDVDKAPPIADERDTE